MITIVLPVYNEELVLQSNTLKVFKFCQDNLKEKWQIVISDNGSDDKTEAIGRELDGKYQSIKYLRVNKKGKGHGVIEAWQAFESDIYVYMDVDLSTDLRYLPELVAGIKNGNDAVVGSRFISGSIIDRSWIRGFISRGLRIILKLFLKLRTVDAPCGFKAVNGKVVEEIIPRIYDRDWFFDTEMIFLLEKRGYRVREIPVRWTEVTTRARESKVGILGVIKDYIKNIWIIHEKNSCYVKKNKRKNKLGI